MKRRHCKECLGFMRPTRETHHFDPNSILFICTKCGHKSPWLKNPAMDGSHAELHKMTDGSFSMLSMLSDPYMKWAGRKSKRSRRTK